MSYVSQQFLLCDNTTLANFKNWAQAISAALSSSGWTQTSDTGQVNWSSIASVPSANTYVFEVWAPSDALQTGSTQFFFKIEYGSDGSNHPQIRATIGTSTNGSGTLNGINSSATVYGIGANQGSVVTYDCYFSGDTNRFHMLMWRSLNSNGAPVLISVERTHATDGTDNSDGATIIGANQGNGGGRGQQTIVFGVGAATGIGSGFGSGNAFYVALFNWNNASAAFNNNIPVSPIFPEYGKFGNPCFGVGLVHTQDVAEGCQFTSTLYGATRTYITTGNLKCDSFSNTKFVMRYD